MAINVSGVTHFLARRNMSSIEQLTHARVDLLKGQVRYRTSDVDIGAFLTRVPIQLQLSRLIGITDPRCTHWEAAAVQHSKVSSLIISGGVNPALQYMCHFRNIVTFMRNRARLRHGTFAGNHLVMIHNCWKNLLDLNELDYLEM
jgi:hypothetical protein